MAVKAMLRHDGILSDAASVSRHIIDPVAHAAAVQANAERRARQLGAARRARQIINMATPASPAHPYLVQKRIPPERLWQQDSLLLVPMIDPEGRLWNLQLIRADGTKRFLGGGRTKGLLWFAGLPKGAMCIGEGVATMAAVRLATGHGVLAALSASNLPAIAQIAHERSPSIPIIIAADDDAVGIKAARDAAALTGARIAVPREL